MNDRPRLRHDLDFMSIHHQGRDLILVRDRLGLVAEGRVVPRELAPFLSLLDGSRDPGDLFRDMADQCPGMFADPSEVNGLLDHLDRAGMLHSDRYLEAMAGIRAVFAASRVRPAVHSGRSYPAQPVDLCAFLDGILSESGAPSGQAAPHALVAPHIDPGLGRRTYAAAYSHLTGRSFDRVVVLGIGHQLAGGCFCLTDKEFDTPLGRCATDHEAVRSLRRSGGLAVVEDDFAHRDEHSIEFQVLFLQHLLGPQPFRLVPVLCGSLQAVLPVYSRRAFQDLAGNFLQDLGRLVRDPASRTLVVAGVDLCHVGPKFGHQECAADMEKRVMAHDAALMERCAAGDADGFWQESARVADRYNVCGFSALASLLEILPPCQGRVLDYQMWHEAPTRSAVSFAAAVFDPLG